MHRNHCRIGKRKAGSITKIRVAGFSGTAVTTWAVVVLTTSGRSNAGGPCVATSRRSQRIARKVKQSAAPNSDKPCFTGPTTHAACNLSHRFVQENAFAPLREKYSSHSGPRRNLSIFVQSPSHASNERASRGGYALRRIEYRRCSVRINNRSPTSAGDACAKSSSSFTCNN